MVESTPGGIDEAQQFSSRSSASGPRRSSIWSRVIQGLLALQMYQAYRNHQEAIAVQQERLAAIDAQATVHANSLWSQYLSTPVGLEYCQWGNRLASTRSQSRQSNV